MSSSNTAVNSVMGLMSHLTPSELREILNDEEKFEQYAKEIKTSKDGDTEKEMLIASNRSLAEFNLTKEPELSDGKVKLRELYEEGEKLYNSVLEKVNILKGHKSSTNPETILALLQTAACETEEESDKMAEKFLSGDIELDGFLEDFVNQRKNMHLRKAKSDKMAELLRRRNSSYRSSIENVTNKIIGYPQPGYSQQPYFQPNNSVPYPSMPVNMPMPMPGNPFINKHF
ncbi:vacuolar protein sorting-associated protein 37B [Daktulosphaira vitifoliae]|uniref:vacuolar protein sorting-associated protein 37B n=1 Tax=Daktulosphaira vitifoliae TaxID=58002 RepID=UPI0021A9E1FA|nr:vacuolar protein sorting-associated protein 37B [Daktulosphaira vitifoliae]